ncbi:bleomycin resistance protein [Phenylobacterium sp.]|uniref:bleomycin resistance protein n=1 Tax=Phenylobacterium sp. TaxID=1871053 RepID=UPI00356A3252
MTAPLVPELDVTDLDLSLAFYCDVLGFVIRYARPEERFAYLQRDGAELMLEEAAGPGRRFRTAALEPPFGRGMNLQIRVADAGALCRKAAAAQARIVVDLEDRWYRRAEDEVGNRQFVVADPDGYLLRFYEDLGARPA